MDKYSIIRKIGQGSFGNVLLIRCKNNRKKYVLKKINLQNLRSEELKATYQEVHLLASLNHPNIVSYKDAFKTKEGYLYIVMVYCDGGDMYTKIKNQKGIYFPEDQIIQWIIQISLALQYLHNKNILHRDLKTQNIFLSKNNVVKIGDFGIAKILDSDDSMANTMIGTPYYMSPELFSKKSYNHKSDVWSLGCCIYEITSLRHAFDARDINSLMHKILRGKLPTMPSHYSFELQELICNLLHLEPEKRPSATKILHSLFIEKHVQLFLEVTKTDELISINRTKISGKFHQKNINKTLFNKDKDELILEGQGLNCQMDQQKQIQKNNQFIRTDQDLNETRLPFLIINGQEIKLGNRAFEQDSPKHHLKMEKDNCKNKQDGKKLKPKRISNSNSNQTQTCSNACISAHANETNSDTDSSKLLPSKIEKKLKPASSGLNPYFHTKETCRKNRKGKSREQVQLHKTQEKDKSEEISQITSIINIFDKTFHTAIKSTKNPQISSNDCNDKRLQTEIAHLRHDCANGLGQDVLTEALQLVNQFSSIKLEVGLKRLLGKKNYTNYMGKIWQLKFYEDSVLSTNASK